MQYELLSSCLNAANAAYVPAANNQIVMRSLAISSTSVNSALPGKIRNIPRVQVRKAVNKNLYYINYINLLSLYAVSSAL